MLWLIFANLKGTGQGKTAECWEVEANLIYCVFGKLASEFKVSPKFANSRSMRKRAFIL